MRPDDEPGSVLVRRAALAMLTFVAVLLALFGAFLAAVTPVPGLSAGVVIGVVGNYAVITRARRVARTAAGAAVPALAWLAVVMTLASGRREGDVILTGSGGSLAFIVLGALSAAVALGRRPPEDAPDLPDEAAEPGH